MKREILANNTSFVPSHSVHCSVVLCHTMTSEKVNDLGESESITSTQKVLNSECLTSKSERLGFESQLD